MNTLNQTLEQYCLLRDLQPGSEQQMRTIARVFLGWLGVDDIPIDEFTGDKISEFLLSKQRSGRSSHYRRSLRNCLKALHRFGRGYNNCDVIRPVKLADLEPDAWTIEEVCKLIEACDYLPHREWAYWRTLLQVGYYTGMNHCDIRRIERANIDPRGRIPFLRHKTGKRVFVAIPEGLAEEILEFAPESGPIWGLNTSQEAFRTRFNRLVRLAGISPGSFKRLRKTSGTLVELEQPGLGHRHLGNEAAIFAKHYEDRKVTQATPTMPPELPLF